MEFSEVIAKRYSCKNYDGSGITDAELAAILEAGRLSPTAKNTQEQHIYVIRSQEGLAKIDAATPCRYGAPVVLAVAFNCGGAYPYPGGKYDSGREDATIVATHMILAAANAGVDSCWLNRFDPDALAADLGLPKEEELLALIDLGHAAEGGGPLPNHFSRKPLSETVSYL